MNLKDKIGISNSNLTLLFIIGFFVLAILGISNVNIDEVSRLEKIANKQDKIDSLENQYKNFQIKVYKEELTYHVNEYIEENSFGSKLSGDTLVKYCMKYNISVPFALAQGHIESHFGTRGVAGRTNSVFNVGTFDNGVILYRYDHPNESIKPYLKLLKEDYLTKGRDIYDLMQRNSFVNHSGYRYASYIHYERKVKDIFHEIKDSTRILTLQSKIEKLRGDEFKLKYDGNRDQIYLTLK